MSSLLSHILTVSSKGVLQVVDLMYHEKQVDSEMYRDKISKPMVWKKTLAVA